MNAGQLRRTGNIFENQAYAGVGQDKEPPRRFMGSSSEPLTANLHPRTAKEGSATAIPTAVDRPTHHGSETRRTEHIAGRVPPHVKSEILRLGILHGWTESKTIATLLEQALARNLAEQFGVRLAAVVTDAINKGMAKHSNRLASLSVKVLRAAEEGRILNKKALRYLFGEDTDIYKQTVEDAENEASRKIARYFEGE